MAVPCTGWQKTGWFQPVSSHLCTPCQQAHTVCNCLKREIRLDGIKKCHRLFSLSRRWVWLWREQVIPQRRYQTIRRHGAECGTLSGNGRLELKYHIHILNVYKHLSCECVSVWVSGCVIGGWWSRQGAVIIMRQPRNGEVPVHRSAIQHRTLLNICQALC